MLTAPPLNYSLRSVGLDDTVPNAVLARSSWKRVPNQIGLTNALTNAIAERTDDYEHRYLRKTIRG
jgi:hypothetical protein